MKKMCIELKPKVKWKIGKLCIVFKEGVFTST